MAGCTLKDFNELVPDFLNGIETYERGYAIIYLNAIMDRIFNDLDCSKNKQNDKIAARARRLKNVVKRLEVDWSK